MDDAEHRFDPEKAVADAINAAEDVQDSLDDLIERTRTDPGAPFAPEILEQLAALQKNDLAGFETLRTQLKAAGCRVTALDKALAGEDGDTGARDPKQADVLIGLAAEAELFHTADSTGYADFEIHGHRETWAIRSKMFKRWLARRFFEETRKAPNSEALQSALNVIEANALFGGPERTVFIRVGGYEGKLYLDLCDPTWRVVEIDATGWRVTDNPPVRFRRAAGMKPLPVPVSGGSIEMLRSFLNVQSDTHFVLAVSWMLAVLRHRGPYPVLVLSGEQGSAKSTLSAILRALLDPNTAPLRALPREDRELFIAATNGHVLTFDNVSGLRPWISDTLCRLATGGGFAVRQLYTDQDEVLFDAARPLILNGIEDIVERPDLADRAVFLTLEPIPEERRRPQAELWAAFETERPRILGALLDAVVEGLKRLPETRLPGLPRMADFALWAAACETALWSAGTFWSAYCSNRDEAVEGVIEADPVAAAVRAFMSKRTEWTGTASDLLGTLAEEVDERISKSKTWPDSPRALSGRLRRAATFLRKIGIEVVFKKEGRARTRVIHIAASAPGNADAQPSAPSAQSAAPPKSTSAIDFQARQLRTVVSNANGGEAPTVRANPLQMNAGNVTDGTDANSPLAICGQSNRNAWLEGSTMSGALALKSARAVGIRVRIDGDHLELEAPAQPPQEVLDLLSLHKADILSLLRPTNDSWSPEDWQVFFDERAGIAEFDGGLPRAEAEARAFASCVTEWLNSNPTRSAPGQCLGCGRSEQPDDPLLPFGTETRGHAWLHRACWPAWCRTREAEAIAALAAMGIRVGN